MKINVKIVPGSKRKEIRKESDYFKVYLKSKPEKGKANRELIDLLSSNFNIPKNSIKIIKGEHSKNKIIDLGGKNETSITLSINKRRKEKN